MWEFEHTVKIVVRMLQKHGGGTPTSFAICSECANFYLHYVPSSPLPQGSSQTCNLYCIPPAAGHLTLRYSYSSHLSSEIESFHEKVELDFEFSCIMRGFEEQCTLITSDWYRRIKFLGKHINIKWFAFLGCFCTYVKRLCMLALTYMYVLFKDNNCVQHFWTNVCQSENKYFTSCTSYTHRVL